MIDIEKEYKKLMSRFYRSCPDANGDISIDDGAAYMKQQDEFLRIAREYYSDDTLDFNKAVYRVQRDVIAKEEFKKSEEKGRCK